MKATSQQGLLNHAQQHVDIVTQYPSFFRPATAYFITKVKEQATAQNLADMPSL